MFLLGGFKNKVVRCYENIKIFLNKTPTGCEGLQVLMHRYFFSMLEAIFYTFLRKAYTGAIQNGSGFSAP